MISERTKAAMKAAKARGVSLAGLRDKDTESYSAKPKNAPKDSAACLTGNPSIHSPSRGSFERSRHSRSEWWPMACGSSRPRSGTAGGIRLLI